MELCRSRNQDTLPALSRLSRCNTGSTSLWRNIALLIHKEICIVRIFDNVPTDALFLAAAAICFIDFSLSVGAMPSAGISNTFARTKTIFSNFLASIFMLFSRSFLANENFTSHFSFSPSHLLPAALLSSSRPLTMCATQHPSLGLRVEGSGKYLSLTTAGADGGCSTLVGRRARARWQTRRVWSRRREVWKEVHF